jgi:hypothetical protein
MLALSGTFSTCSKLLMTMEKILRQILDFLISTISSQSFPEAVFTDAKARIINPRQVTALS